MSQTTEIIKSPAANDFRLFFIKTSQLSIPSIYLTLFNPIAKVDISETVTIFPGILFLIFNGVII